MRHIHPTRNREHDGRRAWRRQATIERWLAQAILAQRRAQQKAERLAAENAELIADLAQVEATRRATA